MKQAVITLDEHGVPVHISFDGEKPVPIDAFVLLSNVSSEPPSGHVLAYGNSNIVGQLIFGFWANSAKSNPEGAIVIEQVARDIIAAADKARGPEYIMPPDVSKEDGPKFH